jgi:hypothetical protein
MKKKKRKRLEREVLAILDDWTPCLGLEPYEREVKFFRTRDEFRRDKHSIVAARVWCDWRYQTIYLEVCLPVLAEMTAKKRERTMVHELVHALVHPMSRRKKKDNEEFVVTNLTNAFIWTRNRARGAEKR